MKATAFLAICAVLTVLLGLFTVTFDKFGTESTLDLFSGTSAAAIYFPVSYVGVKCGCEPSIFVKHERFDYNAVLPYSCPKSWEEDKDTLIVYPDKLCEGGKDEVSAHFPDTLDDFEGSKPHPLYEDSRKQFPKCKRYIIADVDGSGLGHRHGTVVFAVNLAVEYGFTLVLSDSLRTSQSSHGQYLNFRELLGLENFLFFSELDRTNLKSFVVDCRESFFREYFSTFRHQCNIIVSAEIGNHTSCRTSFLRKPKYCFDFWPGAYERARRYLKPTYPAPDPSSLIHFDAARRRRALSVAWHVRCGDIVVDRGPGYFAGILALIASSGVDHQHYVFWQGCNATFSYLRQVLPSAVIVDADADAAFRHMRGADVLVHSGSSFASSAALAAPAPQLYFQSPPKETRWGGDSKVTYALRAAVNVGADGLLEPFQSFAVDAAARAAASASASGDGSGGELNWTQIYQPHVTRILQALHIRKQRGLPPGPSHFAAAAGLTQTVPTRMPAAAAGSALKELRDFLAYRVISGALSGAAPEDLDVWTHNAALARRLLPGWTLQVHYNGSLPHNLCRLREFANVQMVEMSTSTLPSERWQFLPLFGGGVHYLVFLGSPARTLTPCDVEAITAWASCGAGAGALRLGSCVCRSLLACSWAVGPGGLLVARNALASSMHPGPGRPRRALTKGEEFLLLRIGRGGNVSELLLDVMMNYG